MRFPVGTRFDPKDLGLVRLYLRNMVERKQSSFITTMDVYQDEPWLLPHVSNPLFKNKEWYYFVPRNKLRGKIPRRTVPGRGGSEGGYWKSTDGKKDILDGHNRVMGYKQCLTYHTRVHGEGMKTDWLMTEYSLHKGDDEFQDLVLCRIRDKTKTKVNKFEYVRQTQPQPQPQVAENTEGQEARDVTEQQQEEGCLTGFADELETMILEGQEDRDVTEQQQEEVGLTGFDDELETMMLEGQEDRDVTEQQQEEEIQIIPLAQIHENNNNVMMLNQQVQEKAGLAGFANELDMLKLMLEGEQDRVIQLQQQQLYEEILIFPPMQSGDNNNNNNKKNNNEVMIMSIQLVDHLIGLGDKLKMMMLGGQEERDVTQHKQKQLEEEIPIPPPMQNNDNTNNDDVMMMWNQEQFQLLQPIPQAQDPSQLVGQDDTMVLMNNPINALELENYEFIDLTRVDEGSDTNQRR